ncbi:MAG TPA: AtpZ/AtpI family protein [Thiopseudomonas sp.]|nr:AtpZ/AtpI family protein [Thiopseudomonas sp.]
MNKKDDASNAIRRRAERMEESRNAPKYSPLSGLGVFGVVGWSVAIPTVAGAFLGMWLNRVAPQDFSWPIALILGGVVVGALVAWSWIDKNQG